VTAEPLEIVLEFARGEATGDPHAFRFGPQAYVVRTPRGGFGGAELTWDDALLDRLAALQGAAVDPALVAEVGELLRRFLAPAGWELHEQQISAAVQQRRPVRIAVRSAAAELFALPWELLTLRATGQSLGGLPGVLVRYEWPETTTAPRVEVPGPEHVLVAWSAAGGAVPAAEHIAAIRAAAPTAEVLASASPGRLSDELTRRAREGRPVAALHLLCHGGRRGQAFGLVLDGETGQDPPVVLDPTRVQQILAPHVGTLRLVVVSACNSGDAGELGARLGSTAQMLHRAGLATVVASRFPLSVAGSVRMTTAFWAARLGEQASPEQAFLAARTALAGDAASLDWASVQLYGRAEEPARPAVAAVPPAPTPVPSRAPLLPAAGGGALAVLLAGLWIGGVFGRDTGAPRDETGPAKVEPKVEPTEPTKTEPAKTEPGKTEPGKTEPAKTEPEPTATKKVEPKKVEPKKVEPKKVAPAHDPIPCSGPTLKAKLRTYLKDEGGRTVSLVVRVDAKGRVSATSQRAGAGDLEAARTALNAADAAEVVRLGGEELPCFFPHEWKRP
jgi:hypothetical protein